MKKTNKTIGKRKNKKYKISNKPITKNQHLILFIAIILIAFLAFIVYYLSVPVQLAPPDEFRVFVTKETFNGGFRSIFGADTICTQLANQAGLPGNNWRAWLSNEFIPITEHISPSEFPYVMYDSEGTSYTIANDWNDLIDREINVPINLNQFGEVLGSERVWTGTKSDGTLSIADCKNWRGAAKVYFGMTGLTSVTDLRWTENSDIDQCGFPRHIYCVQQPDIIQQRIRVFVTSDRYNGAFGGLAGLDALCEDHAANANLNRPDTIGWKAWASDTQTAMKDRYTNYELPFVRLADDVQIADGWKDLTDGSIDAQINRDERGAYISEKIWTHTTFNGSSIPLDGNLNACSDWTSNSNEDKAGRGDTNAVNLFWTASDSKSCEGKARIYCFEEIQTNNEVCNDGVDNDGDGFADCADDVCVNQRGQDGGICEPGREQTCNDGKDNDGDGVADCLDEDCDEVEGCQFTGESQCGDGSDNDGDNLIDCQDPNCNGRTGPNGETCEPNGEATCGDGFDNDVDGLTDCLDNNCNGKDSCEFGFENTCYDGKDNDGDGQGDCLDNDCSQDNACEGFTVFVTSDRHPPNFGGTAGADAICEQLAANAGLGGTWKAWASDTTTAAKDRICQPKVPYIRIDKARIADDFAGLTSGALQSQINVDQNGVTIISGLDVWTNTNQDGTITTGTTACNDWTATDSTIRAGTGKADAFDGTFTAFGTSRCSLQSRIYCIEVPFSQGEIETLCAPGTGQNEN